MNNGLPFPTEHPYDERQLGQLFWQCSHTRCPDPDFHFSLLLGQNWRPVDVPSEAPEPGEPSVIAYFRSLDRPGLRGEVEVTALLLPREVAPADWLDAYLEHHGHTVVNRREEATPGGAVADVLTRSWGERGWLISRWTAIKDFNRLFVIQARSYEPYYYKHTQAFFVALSSFEVLHTSGWPYAERLLSFSRRYPGDFCFFYPESWQLQVDPDSHMHALGVDVVNQHGDAPLGKMRLNTVAREHLHNVQELADQYVETLKATDLEVPPIRLFPREEVGGFEEMWEGKATVSTGSDGLDIRLTAGKRPDAWFLVALLCPTRETDVESWAVNKRAYEIMLDRFLTPTEEQLAAAAEAEEEAAKAMQNGESTHTMVE
ncbi:MAG: hypothetical protein ACE5G0_07445 [Rhodothermales bacterium]